MRQALCVSILSIRNMPRVPHSDWSICIFVHVYLSYRPPPHGHPSFCRRSGVGVRAPHPRMDPVRARLAALRTDHHLCDGEIVAEDGETFPIHTAIVASLSPVFKAAFCGDFKERREKRLVLNEVSPEVVNVILDCAYGSFEEDQLADTGLCLQVWRDAECYQINYLTEAASKVARVNPSADWRVRVLQHACMYGTEGDYADALANFASKIVGSAENCPDFGDLPADELTKALRSVHLLACEGEILDVITKWVQLNNAASKEEVEGLYGLVRLERLKDANLVEILLESEDSPRSLCKQASRLYLLRRQANAAKAKKSRSRAIFVRARDGLRGLWTHFRLENLAMAVCVNERAEVVVKCEHHEAKPLFAGFVSLDVSISEATQAELPEVEAEVKIAPLDEMENTCTVPLGDSVVELQERTFWVSVRRWQTGEKMSRLYSRKRRRTVRPSVSDYLERTAFREEAGDVPNEGDVQVEE